MSTNMNPVTGIRYGIISANSLDPEVVHEMQMDGTDVHWADHIESIRAEVMADDSYLPEDKEDEINSRIELEGDRWYDDEPIHVFGIDCPGYGVVKGQTTWLGGALLVFIFESPFQEACDLCSPCVPNCGNLDSRNPDGYQCYDVPNDWRYENDQHRNNQEPA